MSPEKQRIAIAEACGWRFGVWSSLNDSVNGWYSPSGRFVGHHGHLPDYPNDLNAIHAVEKTLESKLYRIRYIELLSGIISDSRSHDEMEADRTLGCSPFLLTTATAPQRVEAFLKTVGRWEP